MMPEEATDTNYLPACRSNVRLTVLTIERYVLGTVYQQMWILLR